MYIRSTYYYTMKDTGPYNIRLGKMKAALEAKAFELEIKTPDLIRQILREYLSRSESKTEPPLPAWSSEDVGRYMELSRKLFGNVNGQ